VVSASFQIFAYEALSRVERQIVWAGECPRGNMSIVQGGVGDILYTLSLYRGCHFQIEIARSALIYGNAFCYSVISFVITTLSTVRCACVESSPLWPSMVASGIHSFTWHVRDYSCVK